MTQRRTRSPTPVEMGAHCFCPATDTIRQARCCTNLLAGQFPLASYLAPASVAYRAPRYRTQAPLTLSLHSRSFLSRKPIDRRYQNRHGGLYPGSLTGSKSRNRHWCVRVLPSTTTRPQAKLNLRHATADVMRADVMRADANSVPTIRPHRSAQLRAKDVQKPSYTVIYFYRRRVRRQLGRARSYLTS